MYKKAILLCLSAGASCLELQLASSPEAGTEFSFEGATVKILPLVPAWFHEVVITDPSSGGDVVAMETLEGPCAEDSCEVIKAKLEAQQGNTLDCQPCQAYQEMVMGEGEDMDLVADSEGKVTIQIAEGSGFALELDDDTITTTPAHPAGRPFCSYEPIYQSFFREIDLSQPIVVLVGTVEMCTVTVAFQPPLATGQPVVSPVMPPVVEGLQDIVFSYLPLNQGVATSFVFQKAGMSPQDLEALRGLNITFDAVTGQLMQQPAISPDDVAYLLKENLKLVRATNATMEGGEERVEYFRSTPADCSSDEVMAELSQTRAAFNEYVIDCLVQPIVFPFRGFGVGMIESVTDEEGVGEVRVWTDHTNDFIIVVSPESVPLRVEGGPTATTDCGWEVKQRTWFIAGELMAGNGTVTVPLELEYTEGQACQEEEEEGGGTVFGTHSSSDDDDASHTSMNHGHDHSDMTHSHDHGDYEEEPDITTAQASEGSVESPPTNRQKLTEKSPAVALTVTSSSFAVLGAGLLALLAAV